MVRPVALVLAVAIALPAPVLAQSPPPPAPSGELPVSLARIKRALNEQQPSATKTMDGLKISYYVSVTAEPPHVNLFKDFNLKDGPTSGPPTREELLYQNTPEAFRSPPADFTALIGWLGMTIYKKARHKD